LCYEILEDLGVVEAGKRLVGDKDLEEIIERLSALPALLDQQPVSRHVAAHVLDVPLEDDDGGLCLP